MSLNGLDDPRVKEAHDAAAAEPGGWFLLKYASRDEVELLGRGNGGIVEIRNSIAQFEDKSALFGFLRYRRRNVIIKYLPEDCSRLVQARVSVHFNAVCERFAPYNTTFAIAAAKELKDTKLSAACSLHAASGSTSSSTSSLRRRRLMEIAEEEEEEQRERKRQSVVKEEDSDGPAKDTPSLPSPQSPTPPLTLNSHLAQSPDESKFAGTTEPPPFVGVQRPPSPAQSLDAGRRLSSYQRPDLYSYSSFPYSKPRVKLAPRPSLDIGGRPRTSAGGGNFRPISSIPAGFKLFSKGSKKGRSSDKAEGGAESRGKEAPPDVALLAASIPIPDIPLASPGAPRPHTSGGRPTTSSGVSIRSTMPGIAPLNKQNAITPEKARLMKAMQLREKKRKMSLQPSANIPAVDVPEVPPIPAGLEHPKELAEETIQGNDGELLGGSEHDAETVSKADSGIDVASSMAGDHASVDTLTDSHPASPLAMSSELGDSTKASSLSESTDETVQAQEQKLDLAREDDHVDAGLDEQTSGEDERIYHKRMSEIEEASHEGDDEEQAEEPEDTLMEPQEAHQEESPAVAAEEPPKDPVLVPLSKFASLSTKARAADAAEPPQGATGAQAELEDATVRVTPSTPRLKIPTSKFSTQDLSLSQSPPVPDPVSPPVRSSPEESRPARTPEANEAGRASIESRRSKRSTPLEPIRTDLEIPPEKEAALSEIHSDDDELLDELQSATVQEAKHLTVSKTPITPVFPGPTTPLRATDANSAPRVVRTVSNPIRGPDVSTGTARTVSSGAAFLHKITQQTSASNLAAKKSAIGSSISQRIKALEKLSGGVEGGDNPPRAERPSTNFFSVRKTSGREPSRSPSVADRANSLSRGQTPSPPDSAENSPESKLAPRDRSGSMASRLSVFEGGSLPRGRPESVQVTARIVRDPGQPFPKMPELRPDSTELAALELRQSPLVVDHRRGSTSPSPSPGTMPAPTLAEAQETPRMSIQERRMSKEKRRSQSTDRTIGAKDEEEENPRPRRRSSLSIVKDFIKERRGSLLGGRSPSTDNLHLASPATIMSPSRSPSRPPSTHTTSGLARRLSISSRRSSMSKDRDLLASPVPTPLSPSLMTEASGSGDEARSSPREPGHKKTNSGGKSRAGRFMRRLSSSLSSGRKTATPTISPTVAEEDEMRDEGGHQVPPSSGGSSITQPTIVSYMGDVNVQFPDNLLWKRRTLCLDSQGFLILSAVQGVTATSTAREKQAGAIKRFHMSDFRLPYTPEMEVQELPNSVCLDFVDGSGLQIACEDRPGQLNVLHVLQEAHQSHTSFGQ